MRAPHRPRAITPLPLAPLLLAALLVLTTGCNDPPAADSGAPLDVPTDLFVADIPGEDVRPDIPPPQDTFDAADASDAQDVFDASDAQDVFDASDAQDVFDASDASDASDAQDVGADVPIESGPPTLAFDAPDQWFRLGASYQIGEDINGDGRRDAFVIADVFGSPAGYDITFALAQPSGDFTPAGTLSTRAGNGGARVEFGDFDGDHHTDVLVRVASATIPSSFVFLGRGDGTFLAPESLTFIAEYVADFTGDGRDDVLSGIGTANGALHIRTPDGHFTNIPLGFPTTGAVSGDFDGDGNRDLAIGSTIRRGLGGGAFAPATAATCADCDNPITAAAVARLDGDARDDLILGGATHVVALLGQASGPLREVSSFAVPRARELAVDDLDADGRLDVLALSQPLSGGSGSDQLTILYGDGTGLFPDVRNYQNPRGNSGPPVVTDVDSDGLRDIVLEGRFVLYGRGDRRVRGAELSVIASGTTGHAIVPLDGPGPLELVVPTSTATISRWQFQSDRRLVALAACAGPGTGTTRLFGDLDGDGHTDVYSIGSGALSVWLGAGGCAFGPEHRSSHAILLSSFVDVNADGMLDLVYVTTGNLAVSLASAAGDYGPAVMSPFAGTLSFLATGDWNHDGFVDAVVVDNSRHLITPLRGDAARAFTPQTAIPIGAMPAAFPTPGDIDRDGDVDVIYSIASTGQIMALRNDGTGAFAAPTVLMTVTSPTALALLDLDRDGFNELLIADNQVSTSVFALDATGANRILRMWLPSGVAPYDVDGDGDMDLVGGSATTSASAVAVTNNRLRD